MMTEVIETRVGKRRNDHDGAVRGRTVTETKNSRTIAAGDGRVRRILQILARHSRAEELSQHLIDVLESTEASVELRSQLINTRVDGNSRFKGQSPNCKQNLV